MRPARRADPPHRPDDSKKPRSPLQSPSPDRLPDPSAGAQSFTHSDTDISLPPIASYPTPQLGSKMTKARTAAVTLATTCVPPRVLAERFAVGTKLASSVAGISIGMRSTVEIRPSVGLVTVTVAVPRYQGRTKLVTPSGGHWRQGGHGHGQGTC